MNDRLVLSSGNMQIFWLNSDHYLSINDCCNGLTKIQQLVTKATLYTDTDLCIDELTDIVNEKICLILSTNFCRKLIPLIHDLVQLYSIYVITDINSEHQSWMDEFGKLQCVSSSIDHLCQLLEKDAKKYHHGFIPISFIPTDQHAPKALDELPASFMYSQIFKEILSDIGDHPSAREDLVHYWYEQYNTNESQLEKIGEFDRTYCSGSAIRWYSREPFVYAYLNQALRTLDVDVFIKMGFFLRDLDQQIKRSYEEQSNNPIPLMVYRGQGMNTEDFEKLRQCPNGLLSFNNFVSTSANQNVAEMFLPNPAQDLTTTAIIFKIEIDRTIKSAPYVLLDAEQTNFPDEQEILFSMHSVFRVTQVFEMRKDFWQVNLKLTNDKDEDLIKLTNFIRKEIEGGTGWHRLGLLLIKTHNFTKAEEIYETLLQQAHPLDIQTRTSLLHQIGLTHHYKANFHKALELYTTKLKLDEQNPLADPTHLATTYNNIGAIHESMGKYSEALDFYDKTLQIEEHGLSTDSSALATTYSNIGSVHRHNGNYQKAIEMYSNALEIGKNSLPENHPDFIFMHNNIGTAYYHLDMYLKALEHHEKALTIERKSVSPNDTRLALTYSQIGTVHKKMENFSTAMDCYQKALASYQSRSKLEHPDLAPIYNNMAAVYLTQKKYDTALEFFYRTLAMEEKFYGSFHLEVADTYKNIGVVFMYKGEYLCALEHLEKAQKIYERYFSPDHLKFALLYNQMGVAHYYLQNYAQALYLLQRALPILKAYLPSNHHDLRECEENIDSVREAMTYHGLHSDFS